VHADQVSLGLRHACVLSGGKVSCWGQNVAGNLGIGNANLAFQPYPVDVQTGFGLPATVDAIGCGFDFTCALAGGGVWCWGADDGNEIGNPSVPRSICNSNYCLPTPTPVQMALPDGGSSQMDGGGPDQSQLTGITSMVVGYLFGCGLDASGTIMCWGEEVGGVTFVPEAQEFTSASQPYTSIKMITAWGEDWSALRYVTASGVYVSGNQSYVPYCQ
jgi:alpha-tubulin suppressor-like RCC1 family protein